MLSLSHSIKRRYLNVQHNKITNFPKELGHMPIQVTTYLSFSSSQPEGDDLLSVVTLLWVLWCQLVKWNNNPVEADLSALNIKTTRALLHYLRTGLVLSAPKESTKDEEAEGMCPGGSEQTQRRRRHQTYSFHYGQRPCGSGDECRTAESHLSTPCPGRRACLATRLSFKVRGMNTVDLGDSNILNNQTRPRTHPPQWHRVVITISS